MRNFRNDSQKRRIHGRDRSHVIFYAVVFVGVCWLQFTANIFCYFANNRHDFTSEHVGPFALTHVRTSGKSDLSPGEVAKPTVTMTHNGHNIAPTNASKTSATHLQVQLLDLKSRFKLVKDRLVEQIEAEEASDPSNYLFYRNEDQRTRKQIFVPFTIRDAQRTVPTQIPYGFNVFEFIDIYATNGDQNQTRTLDFRGSNDTDGVGTSNPTLAGLFHNGHKVSDEDIEKGYANQTECLEYSKECYRSKFLRVIKYLMSLQPKSSDVDYYYFYMEADNNLCVSLSKIRELAFFYDRYFISTGIGASGWIMSSRFLKEFYDLWKEIAIGTKKKEYWHQMSEKEKLEPDSVASYLLREKRQWSVTRQYLTSHSILIGNTEDAASLSNLYERDMPDDSDVVAEKEEQSKIGSAAKKRRDEERNATSAVLTPARYLPRCLEPHRGVWPKSDNDRSDIYNWGFFDYNLCPESDVFPCQEGQLDQLAKRAPNSLRQNSFP